MLKLSLSLFEGNILFMMHLSWGLGLKSSSLTDVLTVELNEVTLKMDDK